jgi:sugar/nucleoside kinase (ribokinase family)/DNA-binding XRE family transcriptional regulator
MKQQINIASNIVKLRKKKGLTQSALAEKLHVSNKTVSKWERGAGYPEITQLISLSKILGVSIDALLLGERYGIAIAGNILTDMVKMIDLYPKTSMLANVSSITRAVGGCVPNTGIDLAVIDRTLSISALGCIGDDEGGRYVVSELNKYGIDTGGVTVLKGSSTSFSDVMTVKGTGERTFFHHRGANALFSPEFVDISALSCKMLHIGYILLLDKFDTRDDEYGTVMARFLKEVQDAGIKTSIDVVSDSGDRFSEMVIPALKFTDNAIMNEIEGCGVLRIEPRDENGRIRIDNIKKAMEHIMSCGVSERVILHCPEAGFILNRNGEFTAVPSISLPAGYIKGTVGAGDAFCAGCLYGIYNGMSDKEILEFASGAAVCNLAAEDSVSGMKSRDEIIKIINGCQRQTL